MAKLYRPTYRKCVGGKMVEKRTAKRDAAINPETRAIYGRERLRWMNLQARLEVALILAR